MERLIAFCVLVFHLGLTASFPFPEGYNIAYQQPVQYQYSSFAQPQASVVEQQPQQYNSYQNSNPSYGGNVAYSNGYPYSNAQQRSNYGSYMYTTRHDPVATQVQPQQHLQEQIEDQIKEQQAYNEQLSNQIRIQNIPQHTASELHINPVQNPYPQINGYNNIHAISHEGSLYYPLEQQLPQANPSAQWAPAPEGHEYVQVPGNAQSSVGLTQPQPTQAPSNPFQQIYHHYLKNRPNNPSGEISQPQQHWTNLWKQFSDSTPPPRHESKRYLVIHPDGHTEYVDRLDAVAKKHPNYVLVNAGTIPHNANIPESVKSLPQVTRSSTPENFNNSPNPALASLIPTANGPIPTSSNSQPLPPAQPNEKTSPEPQSESKTPTSTATSVAIAPGSNQSTTVSSPKATPTPVPIAPNTKPNPTTQSPLPSTTQPSTTLKPTSAPTTNLPPTPPTTPSTTPTTKPPSVVQTTKAPSTTPTSTPTPVNPTTKTPSTAPTTKATPTTKAPPSVPTTKATPTAPTTKTPSSAPTTKPPTPAPTTKAPSNAPTKPGTAPTTKAPVGPSTATPSTTSTTTPKPTEATSKPSTATASATAITSPAVVATTKPSSSSTTPKPDSSKQDSPAKQSVQPDKPKPPGPPALPPISEQGPLDLTKVNTDEPVTWFKTSDNDIINKLFGDQSYAVVYLFNVHAPPLVEKDVITTIYPDGSKLEEIVETVKESEDATPKVTKTVKRIPAEEKKP